MQSIVRFGSNLVNKCIGGLFVAPDGGGIPGQSHRPSYSAFWAAMSYMATYDGAMWLPDDWPSDELEDRQADSADKAISR